jgi:hypothetical protein
MAVSSKVLARAAASTTVTTTLYTTPGATTAVVTNIAVANTSNSGQTFTLYLNGVLIHNTSTVDAFSTAYIDLKQVLTAGQTIQGGASATSVNFHISGVEIS